MHLLYTGWILKHGCWLDTSLSKGPEDKLRLQTRLWNTLIFQEVTCDIRSRSEENQFESRMAIR